MGFGLQNEFTLEVQEKNFIFIEHKMSPTVRHDQCVKTPAPSLYHCVYRGYWALQAIL